MCVVGNRAIKRIYVYLEEDVRHARGALQMYPSRGSRQARWARARTNEEGKLYTPHINLPYISMPLILIWCILIYIRVYLRKFFLCRWKNRQWKIFFSPDVKWYSFYHTCVHIFFMRLRNKFCKNFSFGEIFLQSVNLNIICCGSLNNFYDFYTMYKNMTDASVTSKDPLIWHYSQNIFHASK